MQLFGSCLGKASGVDETAFLKEEKAPLGQKIRPCSKIFSKDAVNGSPNDVQASYF